MIQVDSNIRSRNKIIAEFMGYSLQKSIFRSELVYRIDEHDRTFSLQPDGGNEFSADELHYSNSWDWLIPVCQKIIELGYQPFERFYFEIDKVWNIVVEWIIWYNEQNK